MNNDHQETKNLTRYRQGGNRSQTDRHVFWPNMRCPDPYRTGGQANLLWVDGHVNALDETTGVPPFGKVDHRRTGQRVDCFMRRNPWCLRGCVGIMPAWNDCTGQTRHAVSLKCM
ncbi:MAG: hypothetical protein GY809_06820 [Planctomycetes bacterium]|nr:hypothetical protein [Planctomycetota bacterium]